MNSTAIIQACRVAAGSPDSPIAFSHRGGGSWPEWDRFITLSGKDAFHIGNICNTCSFFFQRLAGATECYDDRALVGELTRGLSEITDTVVSAASSILPLGEYWAGLLDVVPHLVRPGQESDYFAREQVDLWGADPFWCLPHDPRVEYYRLGRAPIGDRGELFQFLVPLVPSRWLKEEGISLYASRGGVEQTPTALALSVLDRKAPADYEGDPATVEHWCLAHYLLDGHHKAYAASTEGRKVRLLSFIAIGEGVSDEEDIRAALRALPKAPHFRSASLDAICVPDEGQ